MHWLILFLMFIFSSYSFCIGLEGVWISEDENESASESIWVAYFNLLARCLWLMCTE